MVRDAADTASKDEGRGDKDAESDDGSGDSMEAQAPQGSSSGSPGKSRRLRKDSLENLDADPWASPVVRKGLTSDVRNDRTPQNAVTAAKPLPPNFGESMRTTSNITTHSEGPNAGAPSGQGGNNSLTSGDEGSGAWSSYAAAGSGISGNGGLGGEGFGGNDDGQQPGAIPSRSLGGGRTTGGGARETVTITVTGGRSDRASVGRGWAGVGHVGKNVPASYARSCLPRRAGRPQITALASGAIRP